MLPVAFRPLARFLRRVCSPLRILLAPLLEPGLPRGMLGGELAAPLLQPGRLRSLDSLALCRALRRRLAIEFDVHLLPGYPVGGFGLAPRGPGFRLELAGLALRCAALALERVGFSDGRGVPFRGRTSSAFHLTEYILDDPDVELVPSKHYGKLVHFIDTLEDASLKFVER